MSPLNLPIVEKFLHPINEGFVKFSRWTRSAHLPSLNLKKYLSPNTSQEFQTLQVWAGYPWPGSSETGAWLVSGLNQYPNGFQSAINAFWAPVDAPGRHCFSWLADLRACGGDQPRQTARYLIASWIEKHGQKQIKPVWSTHCVGQRLNSIVLLYDFHGSSAHESYQALIGDLVCKHADYLYRTLPSARQNKDTLEAASGLIVAALSLSDKKDWLEAGEKALAKNLKHQILPDGGHISRSPQKLARTLKLCLDLKRFYNEAHKPSPEILQSTIDRMGDALQVFRYTDKKLALFHGSQEYDAAMLDLITHQTGIRRKALRSLPDTKFERVTQGRTTVLFDAGAIPDWPYDKDICAAPLAFEMTYGKERMIVNCGSHPFSPEWQDALRGTSAHSTVTIDHRNAAEIRKDSHIGRKPRKVNVNRVDGHGHTLIEADHNGYFPLNGINHARRLYLTDRGQDLRGEDLLTCDIAPETLHQYAIRFHLHPRVKVSLVKDGQEVLLRLPSGTGWRFLQSGGNLKLEESIYLGEGTTPVKTQQIVVEGQVEGEVTQVEWAFQREGS